MTPKTFPLVVLVVALAALGASVGWAATRDGGSGWTVQRSGAGMMGYATAGDERVRSLAGAERQARRFAEQLDLRVGEVMRFTNNYYAELEERDGRLATEVLVDPETGRVFLEYGPAMMWNTRYGLMSDFRLRDSGGMMGGGPNGGMMGGGMGGSSGGMMGGGMGGSSGGMMGGGMMGGGLGDPTWTPGGTEADVSPERARRLADRWLRSQGPGLVASEPDAFPGYYTLHALRDGKVVGMLSVNAATGSVWRHWWHGRFVSMSED